MTPTERSLCLALVVIPPRGERTISKEEFLRQFPSAVKDGKLNLKVLEDAYHGRSADDLRCALTIGFAFSFAPEHIDILYRLLRADWHDAHEDIVSALEAWPSPETIEALYNATQWIPKSLEWDDNRALAKRAIWALGKIPGDATETRLETLARSDDSVLKNAAEEQLSRRHLK